MTKAVKQSAVAIPTVAQDEVITAAAKADPDAQPLTPAQLKAMVPLRKLHNPVTRQTRKALRQPR